MRRIGMWIAAAACAVAIAQDFALAAQPNQSSRRTAAQNQTSAGGCWCRTPDGRWLWVTGTETLPNGKTALRTYSYYRPQDTLYGDDGRPLVIGGIDWYLNGRGPFSD
jgi:hypothetical protein